MLDLINSKENLYGDNIAKVEQYDFSRANMNDEARTLAITSIATVCTQKFDAIGSEKLCTKLLTEAHGIPSSAYGFVPILLKEDILDEIDFSLSPKQRADLRIYKFGEQISIGRETYLLTNLRALIYDVSTNQLLPKKYLNFYNTDENEIAIIKKHFKVFKHKMDMISARQFLRHTTAVWQELSRRYVSGKKVPFEFYICDSMKDVWSKDEQLEKFTGLSPNYNTEMLIQLSVNHYFKALEQGVKPQQARYIIHPCVYTEIWSGWQPFALENMLTERTAIGTQWELRQTALAIKDLINENI